MSIMTILICDWSVMIILTCDWLTGTGMTSALTQRIVRTWRLTLG